MLFSEDNFHKKRIFSRGLTSKKEWFYLQTRQVWKWCSYSIIALQVIPNLIYTEVRLFLLDLDSLPTCGQIWWNWQNLKSGIRIFQYDNYEEQRPAGRHPIRSEQSLPLIKHWFGNLEALKITLQIYHICDRELVLCKSSLLRRKRETESSKVMSHGRISHSFLKNRETCFLSPSIFQNYSGVFYYFRETSSE